jgi:predicted kinase
MGRLTVADATNLEPIPRQRLREMARAHGRPAIAIVFDVPLPVAQARNLARDRQVPPHVVESHYESFRAARPALAAEGYDALYELPPETPVEVVRVGTVHEELRP